MKRTAIVLFLLTSIFFVSQIQTGMAAQEIYLWELPNEDGHFTNEYQIVVTASDDWQPDVPYEVTVRLTTKNSYDVKIDSAEVILNSSEFSLESLSEEESVALTDIGDYWEKKFTFEIPSEKLVSGENFTLSIVAVITISAVPESGDGVEGTWDNYGEPVTVSLYAPSQSTLSEPAPTALVVASII